ncbi:MAG: hypothetical protein JJU35_15100 [Balneolales bacterium]|nr:hypothetical protein [Balneolales bacterium]
MKTDLFRNHPLWWSLLLGGTFLVSWITTKQGLSLSGLLLSTAAHLLFAALFALLPWLIFRFLKKELSTTHLMLLLTLGWAVLAVGNLWVMPG